MKKRTLSLILLSLILLFAWTVPALAGEERAGIYVRITVERYGVIYAELYPEYAPETVANFQQLIGENFYDGLTFHRIISGFMIQGGDPLGNGTGGSGRNITGEFSANGVENPLLHERGVLSMARSADMNSASSQFFIMHETSPHLDGSYAAFGRVLAGLAVVDRICQATPVQDKNGTVLSGDQPRIENVREVAWAEVAEAMEKEAANGLSGTTYVDLLSPVSFPVPEGWNRMDELGGQTYFAQEEQPEKSLLFVRQNNWDPLPAAYKAQLTAQGVTQTEMNTDAFTKATLAGIVGLQEGQMTEEEHSGVTFLTASQTSGDAGFTYYIGVHHGYVYIFAFGADRADPLFADVEGILDSLSFNESF